MNWLATSRNLLVAKSGSANTRLIAASGPEQERLAEIAAGYSEEDLTRYLQLTLDLFKDLQFSLQPRLHVELGLLRLIQAGEASRRSKRRWRTPGQRRTHQAHPNRFPRKGPHRRPSRKPPTTSGQPATSHQSARPQRPVTSSTGEQRTARRLEPASVPHGASRSRHAIHRRRH